MPSRNPPSKEQVDRLEKDNPGWKFDWSKLDWTYEWPPASVTSGRKDCANWLDGIDLDEEEEKPKPVSRTINKKENKKCECGADSTQAADGHYSFCDLYEPLDNSGDDYDDW